MKYIYFLFAAVTLPLTLSAQNPLAFDMKRIEGQGNAGRELEITQSSIDSMFILGNHFIDQPVYEAHQAPILVEVVDLDSIISGNYIVQFDGSNFFGLLDSSANWKMYREGGIDTVYSDSTVGANNTQIIPQWGVAVTVKHYSYPLLGRAEHITSSISTSGTQWLSGISDTEGISAENWISSGTENIDCDPITYPNINNDPCIFNDFLGEDDLEEFEEVVNGTFAPFRLTKDKNHWPNSDNTTGGMGAAKLTLLNSVDIVFTSDTSKWSRCPVFETHHYTSQAIGNAEKQTLREAPSVGKNGTPDGTGNGMGWFPGYTLDIETGERLNIGFGEDSYHPNENGADMLFNPTSTIYDSNGDTVFGGKHYIYVFQNWDKYSSVPSPHDMPNYDEGNFIEGQLGGSTVNAGMLLKVWRACTWVGIPLLENGQTLLSSETKVRIRVKKPLGNYGYLISDTLNATMPMYSVYIDPSITSMQNQEMLEVSVYPNPTETNLTFQLNENSKEYKLEIFDITGKVYKSTSLNGFSTTIDVSVLSKGIYLYYIYNRDGSRLLRGKFVKQ